MYKKHKIIMGLDPSSTACGYAIKTSDSHNLADNFIQAGLITPENKTDAAFERIRSMRVDIKELLNKFKPSIVLVELTRGKVNIRRHHGLGAGLAVYGMGVGGIATEADIWCSNTGSRFIGIYENDWTRGIPKQVRQMTVASYYKQYSSIDDPGGDISDAIGIIDWWLKENLFSCLSEDK
jgi:hypothetical protein